MNNAVYRNDFDKCPNCGVKLTKYFERGNEFSKEVWKRCFRCKKVFHFVLRAERKKRERRKRPEIL